MKEGLRLKEQGLR